MRLCAEISACRLCRLDNTYSSVSRKLSKFHWKFEHLHTEIAMTLLLRVIYGGHSVRMSTKNENINNLTKEKSPVIGRQTTTQNENVCDCTPCSNEQSSEKVDRSKKKDPIDAAAASLISQYQHIKSSKLMIKMTAIAKIISTSHQMVNACFSTSAIYHPHSIIYNNALVTLDIEAFANLHNLTCPYLSSNSLGTTDIGVVTNLHWLLSYTGKLCHSGEQWHVPLDAASARVGREG